jgi:hypothetical protein
MKSPKKILLVAFVGIIAVGGIIGLTKYYVGYWYDLRNSPWAYSDNPSEKLLVGNWAGNFTDPDGVSKQLNINIIEPLSDKERWDKAFTFKKGKSRVRSNPKKSLRGFATVKSKLGTEEYEISGHVEEDNFHQFLIRFSPVDEKKRVLPNFTLFESPKSTWQDDKMSLSLHFSYHKADGSSHWDSGIAKYSAVVKCESNRVN